MSSSVRHAWLRHERDQAALRSDWWKTISLDHIAFQVADYEKEAAFYKALMGWTLRSDDGKQAVMDIGDWGSVILKQGAPASPPDNGYDLQISAVTHDTRLTLPTAVMPKRPGG